MHALQNRWYHSNGLSRGNCHSWGVCLFEDRSCIWDETPNFRRKIRGARQFLLEVGHLQVRMTAFMRCNCMHWVSQCFRPATNIVSCAVVRFRPDRVQTIAAWSWHLETGVSRSEFGPWKLMREHSLICGLGLLLTMFVSTCRSAGFRPNTFAQDLTIYFLSAPAQQFRPSLTWLCLKAINVVPISVTYMSVCNGAVSCNGVEG